MVSFIVRRLIQGIIVIFILSVLVFCIIRFLPGDPILLYLNQNEVALMPQADIEALRAQYGLDKPIPLQYLNWVGGIFHGDLGESLFFKERVTTLIAERLPVTITLGLIAFIIACIIGPILGTICAVRRGKWLDTLITVMANLGITIPSFWLGIMLIYFFSMKLGWLPAIGFTSPFEDPLMSLKQMIMPVVCLCVAPIASLTRQTRSSVLEVIRQDYIRTAWSKGLQEQSIIAKHVLKNAFIPVITVMGMYVRFIFGGAVLVETIFNINGIGRMIVSGVLGQDFHVIQGGVLLISVIVMLSNLLVDVAYGYLDPRIRFD